MAVMSYREALNVALREEMDRDPRVFVIGEEVGLYEGAYKVTQGLLKEFGPRRISSRRAWFNASRYVMTAISSRLLEDVGE